jgi:hypothetical protein
MGEANFLPLPHRRCAKSWSIRLGRNQESEAIEKPIGVAGGQISPLLVRRLLNDVGNDADQLPVLQHALMRTWGVGSDRGDTSKPIETADFEATGGLASALSRHADEIYQSLPDDRARAACETLFKSLTEKGADRRLSFDSKPKLWRDANWTAQIQLDGVRFVYHPSSKRQRVNHLRRNTLARGLLI